MCMEARHCSSPARPRFSTRISATPRRLQTPRNAISQRTATQRSTASCSASKARTVKEIFMKQTIRLFAVLAAFVLAVPASHSQTLTGAEAQKSPQAEAFLAYEKAMIAGGLDAASPHMTSEKLDQMKGDVKQYGEDSYKQFLEQMRRGAQGEARRRL